jgi:hypothetical protein
VPVHEIDGRFTSRMATTAMLAGSLGRTVATKPPSIMGGSTTSFAIIPRIPMIYPIICLRRYKTLAKPVRRLFGCRARTHHRQYVRDDGLRRSVGLALSGKGIRLFVVDSLCSVRTKGGEHIKGAWRPVKQTFISPSNQRARLRRGFEEGCLSILASRAGVAPPVIVLRYGTRRTARCTRNVFRAPHCPRDSILTSEGVLFRAAIGPEKTAAQGTTRPHQQGDVAPTYRMRFVGQGRR